MSKSPYRIGWVLDNSGKFSRFSLLKTPWEGLSVIAESRYRDIGLTLAKTEPQFEMVLFDWSYPLHSALRKCDLIIFLKRVDDVAVRSIEKFRKRGTKIIFDANVNYYEVWGKHRDSRAIPSERQQKNAAAIASMADRIVADSTYLAEICRKFNPNVSWVADPVDTELYRPPANKKISDGKLRLIWSGIDWKAYHFEIIEPVLQKLKDSIDLTLVIDEKPGKPAPVIQRLQKNLGARVEYYSRKKFCCGAELRYPRLLQEADAIISPKILENAYDMGHTEYKITLGMAAGLPALASPQQSYKEALAGNVGGWICETPEQWEERLKFLIANRNALEPAGKAARQRVLDNYSIPVLANKYKEAILNTINR